VWENVASGPSFFGDQCDEMTDQGTMEAGKNNVICMGLNRGPNKLDEICGKMNIIGMMQQGFVV
jgi:hypothetical protein